LSREKEKFPLRHFTEVLKTARWMERFRNSCPERKKNFHSDILLKFLKRLDGWNDLKNSYPERKKNFPSDILLNFYFEYLKRASSDGEVVKKGGQGTRADFEALGAGRLEIIVFYRGSYSSV
jgi:hypothetical protein